MKTSHSLILGAAALLSILPARAFSADLDYGYDSRDTKRGDYYVSRYYSQRVSPRYAWNRERLPVRANRQMTFVPTCYYQGKDGVIAYNYRPVFVRGGNARDARSKGAVRLRSENRAIKPIEPGSGASFSTEVPYRLSQPAVTPNRISAYRTVYSNSRQQVAKERPVRELPSIGEAPPEVGNQGG